jgi:hypothetical protein
VPTTDITYSVEAYALKREILIAAMISSGRRLLLDGPIQNRVRMVLCTAIVLLGLLSGCNSETAYGSWTRESQVMFWATTGYVAFIGLFLLATIWLFYRLIRKVFRIWAAPIFGPDLRVRVVSLGIAVYFFPNDFSQFINAIISFFFTILRQLPNSMIQLWLSEKAIEKYSDLDSRLASRLIFGTLYNWSTTIADAFNTSGIRGLRFGSLILLVATWTFVAHVLSLFVSPEQPLGTPARNPLLERLRTLAPNTRINIVFFTILAIGGYLSIAAIVAIPGFQEGPAPEGLSVDRLRQQLNEEILTDAEFERQFPAKLEDKDPFEQFEDSLEKAMPLAELKMTVAEKEKERRTKLEEIVGLETQLRALSAEEQRNSTIESAIITAHVAAEKAARDEQEAADRLAAREFAISEVGRFRSDRTMIRAKWEPLRTRVRSAQQKALKDAISGYEIENLSRLGSREKARHFRETQLWVRSQLDELDLSLKNARIALTTMDNAWSEWIQGALQARRNFDLLVDNTSRVISHLERLLDPSYYSETNVPIRPELGSYLGPFGFVARWLLRTESLPLALITGLMGFGLLGSACSTMVRERIRQRPGGPIVRDISGVVIRGLSAAIVVFLAVEGSLAVFVGTNVQPNPYVLLFTCLVGAVFSEDVWHWAHRKLTQSLGPTRPAKKKS